ncbi:phage protease [Hafnia paralvei]|uniref:phage protease n=1 Tax=Hafnia paralvei TaxID=546367 RepID=UPI0021099FE2|nr:phage protease [Hafnia paralvei]MCQ4171734.1 phage protease [Hafnia paralvei]
MKTFIAALAIEITKATHGTIQLFPAGEFRAVDGRPTECDHWLMTAEIAQPLIETAALRKTPYVIDYEHQTLHATKNGKPAPAAGFFHTLEWREGEGLFAINVEWTDAAAAMIANGEYRYISPVFNFDESGHVRVIFHAALTNTPALDGMDEAMLAATSLLAAASTTEDHTEMDELLERLRWMLNLPITSTAEDIIAELDKLIGQLSDGVGTAAASVNLLQILTDNNTQLAALSAQVDNPDPARFVAVEVMHQAVAEAAASANSNLAALAQKECDGLITAALSDGRLLPAQKTWATSLAKSNPDSLKSFLSKAPKIVALTQSQTGGKPPAGIDNPASTSLGLDNNEEFDPAICSLMGTDAAEIAKFISEKKA